MGISLARDPHWRIVLKARPAVSPEDSERWKFFTMAVALVTAANQDLKTLLENGAIRLPPTETSVFEPAKVLPGPRRCTGRGGAKFVHSESRKRNGKRKSS
ncbi:hypothetical protein [Desulfobotulus mexicanus]|uniref:Uncharacterized protein n=1 Tax=Desulfobotulus mexicanus TaxID=2586642 RepID=A0A5Q4VDI1_9BACT|nr:hypothetical protein [Desulfobotulus mexicanus]TYT75675.1 hypothetical protein FIM25_04350 [Desulfobotulus mexicanus]